MGYCGKFKSPPNEISVKIGERKRVHDDPLPAVTISDPAIEYEYRLAPDKARNMADLVEANAESRDCIRLADDIRAIADRVENQ